MYFQFMVHLEDFPHSRYYDHLENILFVCLFVFCLVFEAVFGGVFGGWVFWLFFLVWFRFLVGGFSWMPSFLHNLHI